jgi:hypothetical protein
VNFAQVAQISEKFGQKNTFGQIFSPPKGAFL